MTIYPPPSALAEMAARAAVPLECRIMVDGIRRNDDGGVRVTLDFHPHDPPSPFLRANQGDAFLIAVVPLDGDGAPRPPVFAGRSGQNWDDLKPAAQVAMLCRDSRFRAFLSARMGEAIDTEEAASDAACLHCQVDRKRDIEPGTAPAARWAELEADYRRWQRQENRHD